jgi:hypothetical protein
MPELTLGQTQGLARVIADALFMVEANPSQANILKLHVALARGRDAIASHFGVTAVTIVPDGGTNKPPQGGSN